MRHVGCSKLGELIDDLPACCSSCHDDADEGLGDLFEVDVSPEITVYCCCVIMDMLDADFDFRMTVIERLESGELEEDVE